MATNALLKAQHFILESNLNDGGEDRNRSGLPGRGPGDVSNTSRRGWKSSSPQAEPTLAPLLASLTLNSTKLRLVKVSCFIVTSTQLGSASTTPTWMRLCGWKALTITSRRGHGQVPDFHLCPATTATTLPCGPSWWGRRVAGRRGRRHHSGSAHTPRLWLVLNPWPRAVSRMVNR